MSEQQESAKKIAEIMGCDITFARMILRRRKAEAKRKPVYRALSEILPSPVEPFSKWQHEFDRWLKKNFIITDKKTCGQYVHFAAELAWQAYMKGLCNENTR